MHDLIVGSKTQATERHHEYRAVSDRRSVKLQRLVAASALLCGRTRALASDLWILRHVWDTIEQREVLASIVGDALKSAPTDPRDHPRSRAEDAPDPESLALDLEGIGGLLGNAATSDADRAALRDRLAILAARVQWVQDAAKRSFLVDRIEALWPAAGGKP